MLRRMSVASSTEGGNRREGGRGGEGVEGREGGGEEVKEGRGGGGEGERGLTIGAIEFAHKHV